MTAFADVVLNDGAATPVAHTFKVKKTVGTLSQWEDRAGGVPIGYNLLQSETKESSEVRRVKFKVVKPTLEAVSGQNSSGFTPAAKVAYSLLGTVEFVLPQRCTEQERKDLCAYIKNVLANASFSGMITAGDEIAG